MVGAVGGVNYGLFFLMSTIKSKECFVRAVETTVVGFRSLDRKF